MSLRDYMQSKLSSSSERQKSDDLRCLLHKTIKGIEKKPLYYSTRNNFWEKINPLSEPYKGIINRYKSCLKKTNYLFDNLLKKIGDVIISEKNPERVQELVCLYKETKAIKDDYELRNGYWQKVALSLLDKELHIKEHDLQSLRALEEKYTKYTGGRGFAAFNKAKEELDKIKNERNLQIEAERIRLENEQLLKEILNSNHRSPSLEHFAVDRKAEVAREKGRDNSAGKKVRVEERALR